MKMKKKIDVNMISVRVQDKAFKDKEKEEGGGSHTRTATHL